jgi:AcrR family transcriptional regulator
VFDIIRVKTPVNFFIVIAMKMNEPARKRGRPRVLDRDVALEVAARLFWEHGYEGTSIADLTQAMGVTPPSLYATFASNEDLYRQALDHNIERETKRRSEALQGEMTAYDAIAFYLQTSRSALPIRASRAGASSRTLFFNIPKRVRR